MKHPSTTALRLAIAVTTAALLAFPAAHALRGQVFEWSWDGLTGQDGIWEMWSKDAPEEAAPAFPQTLPEEDSWGTSADPYPQFPGAEPEWMMEGAAPHAAGEYRDPGYGDAMDLQPQSAWTPAATYAPQAAQQNAFPPVTLPQGGGLPQATPAAGMGAAQTTAGAAGGSCRPGEFCSHGLEFTACPQTADAGAVRKCGGGICYSCPASQSQAQQEGGTQIQTQQQPQQAEAETQAQMQMEMRIQPQGSGQAADDAGQGTEGAGGSETTGGATDEAERFCAGRPNYEGCLWEYHQAELYREARSQTHLGNLVPVGNVRFGTYDQLGFLASADGARLALFAEIPNQHHFVSLMDTRTGVQTPVPAPDLSAIPGLSEKQRRPDVITGFWMTQDGAKLGQMAYWRYSDNNNDGRSDNPNYFLVYDVASGAWSKSADAGDTASAEAGPFGSTPSLCRAPGLTSSCEPSPYGANGAYLRWNSDTCASPQMLAPGDPTGYAYTCQTSMHVEAWKDEKKLGNIDTFPENYESFFWHKIGQAQLTRDGKTVFIALSSEKDENGWPVYRIWKREIVN